MCPKFVLLDVLVQAWEILLRHLMFVSVFFCYLMFMLLVPVAFDAENGLRDALIEVRVWLHLNNLVLSTVVLRKSSWLKMQANSSLLFLVIEVLVPGNMRKSFHDIGSRAEYWQWVR